MTTYERQCYEQYAREYDCLPNAEKVEVQSMGARGEITGPRYRDIVAIFGEELTESLSGSPVALGGRLIRVVLFHVTMPPDVPVAPQGLRVYRQDGASYVVTACNRQVFGTRWVCDCRRDAKGAANAV